MAASRNSYAYSRENRRMAEQMYVYGNAVPNPAYVPERQEQPRKRRASGQVKRNRRNAMEMNRAYVLFLAIVALCMMICCVFYIQLRLELTSRSQNIAQMQQTLASMEEENTTRYNAIVDSVNMEEVREVAINDLGMIYADQNQIIEYDNPTGDYIQQYESIPEEGILASSLGTDD